jgi:hypothetical protein
MFQSMVARVYGLTLSDNHNPHILSQSMLMLSYNLSQTTPNTISNNRASQPARGNKANARHSGIRHNNCTKHQQFAAMRKTISFYALEF